MRAMRYPNFFVIGAAKAGTTSLYHYLSQHPDVFMSPIKEPRYYAIEYHAGVEPAISTRSEYEQLFSKAGQQRAIGEASPQYLNSPTAPERILADVPEARLVVSLRNPAERAYSSFLHRSRWAVESCTLEEAMRPGSYYFETSLYHPRLTRYFAKFARERIHVLLFDDLQRDTPATVRGVFAFLGIDPSVPFDPEPQNAGGVPRVAWLSAVFAHSAHAARRLLPPNMRDTGLAARVETLLVRKPPKLDPVLRRRLLEQYRDDMVATSALIGRDLTHWLE
jgi:Sulfotransferase family